MSPPDGLGVLEVAVLLTEIGRRAPSMKALATLMTGALPLLRWGRPDLRSDVLRAVASGEILLTAALREPPTHPATAITDGRITGLKTGVPYTDEPPLLLVPARLTHADLKIVGQFWANDTGNWPRSWWRLPREPPRARGGADAQLHRGSRSMRFELDRAPVEGMLGGANCVRVVYQLAVAGACALVDGAVAGALALTRDYVASREQFGRPLAAFQAVSQQIADVDPRPRTCTWPRCRRAGVWPRAATRRPTSTWRDTGAPEQAHPGPFGSVVACHGGIGMDVTIYPLHRFSSLVADLTRYLPCLST